MAKEVEAREAWTRHPRRADLQGRAQHAGCQEEPDRQQHRPLRCSNRAKASFTGQNGKPYDFRPRLSPSGWPSGVAASIRAALAFAARAPVAANEALANGREGYARYDGMLDHFAERLLPGRALRPEGQHLPAIIEKALVGGIAVLVAQRLDQAGELPVLAPEAIQFVLTPYLGVVEARRVALHGSA